MTITEFANARLDELASLWAGGCEGQGEYVSCAAISGVLPSLLDSIRAVLDMHTIGGYYDYDPPSGPLCASCGSGEPHEYPTEWPCPTVLAVVSPWKDHPDYRPEWSTS